MTMRERNAVWLGSLAVAFLIALTIWLVYLPGNRTPETPSESANGATLRVGLAGWGEINTLDPAKAATAAPVLVVWQVYDRLVRISNEGRLETMLATQWTANEAQTEWTFKIRKDAAFQGPQGQLGPVTVSDVRSSIERAIKIPSYGQSLLGDLLIGVPEFLSGEAERIEGIQIQEENITFRLTRPFAFLPERLASSFFSVVPADTPPDTASPPPGSGPYLIANWSPATQTVELSKAPHPYAPHSEASPKTIIVRQFQSEGVAIEELRAGTLDWLEVTSTALPVLRTIEAERGIAIDLPSHTQIRLVALNQEKFVFQSPVIAQALNLATNRQEIVNILGGGSVTPSPIPGDQNLDHQLQHDPEKARQLLTGIAPESLNLTMLVQPGEESKTIAELLRRDWERVGFSISLKSGLADFFPRLVNGDYEMALAYYGPFMPTPEQYLWPYLSTSQPIPNAMRYSSEGFDEAYEQYVAAQTTTDQEKELDTALKILVSNPPTVWIVKPPLVTATRGKLSAPRPTGTPDFYLLERF
ncbi:MAG: ABC transporter substrate-binding protein [Candidatus Thiodiazotropha taylori]